MTMYPVGLLYIEPSRHISPEPVIDELTRKMAAGFRQSTISVTWRGDHHCACGARSDHNDHLLRNGVETNTRCVHYLAYHRAEVPSLQLDIVAALKEEPVEPTKLELEGYRDKLYR